MSVLMHNDEMIAGLVPKDEWVDITNELTWNSAITVKIALYNKTLKLIKIKFYCDGNDGVANSQTYVTLPSKYNIDTTKHVLRNAVYVLFGQVSLRWQPEASITMDYFMMSAVVPSSNSKLIQVYYPIDRTAYKHIGDIEIFVQ